MARRRQRYQQFSDIQALLADIAERQQAPMLQASPHTSDYALTDAVVMQKFPLNVAQHGAVRWRRTEPPGRRGWVGIRALFLQIYYASPCLTSNGQPFPNCSKQKNHVVPLDHYGFRFGCRLDDDNLCFFRLRAASSADGSLRSNSEPVNDNAKGCIHAREIRIG